jgi:glucose/arabinose dehydrogenase
VSEAERQSAPASVVPEPRRPWLAAVAVVAMASLAFLPLLAHNQARGGHHRAHRGAVGAGPRGVRLRKLASFHSPLYITQPPRNRHLLFVVEKAGRVRVIRNGRVLGRPFLDLRDRVASASAEQGLLSIAFAPDYARSGRFYVDFTNRAGDDEIQEYRRSRGSPLLADPNSLREVLLIQEPASIHNGGLLLFGPDRDLYVGVGDGGPSYDPYNTAQNRRSFLGKILRIDPSHGKPYSIPASNPFRKRKGWNEIYAYGLRNPWRFSFDRRTGALAIGDVGQDTWEEVDYRPAGKAAGANFGWSAYEGPTRFKRRPRAGNAIRPVLVYRHGPGCSVTGGYVVRDPRLPSLDGRYLYGDYCTGEVRSFIPSIDRAHHDRAAGLRVPLLSSFGEDNAGHVYAVSLEGPVYELVP